MKEEFERLTTTEEELNRLWQEATFVFDTNVLLDLYTHDKSTTDDLLRAIEEVQDRLFMPHQVLVEFTRNRSSRLKSAKTPFEEAHRNVDNWESKNAGLQNLSGQLENRKNVREDLLPLDDEIEKLSDLIENIASSLRSRIEESKEKHLVTESTVLDPDQDRVLKRLFQYFEDQVGSGYNQERYAEIIKDAEWREEREIPPGFRDISEKSGYYQYGDQLVWHQILDYANTEDVDILLVSGDTSKEDWRKEELQREFARRLEKQLFLYTPQPFLSEAKERFKLDIRDESIGAIEKEKPAGIEEVSEDVAELADSYFRFKTLVNDEQYNQAINEASSFVIKANTLNESDPSRVPPEVLFRLKLKISHIKNNDINNKFELNEYINTIESHMLNVIEFYRHESKLL